MCVTQQRPDVFYSAVQRLDVQQCFFSVALQPGLYPTYYGYVGHFPAFFTYFCIADVALG